MPVLVLVLVHWLVYWLVYLACWSVWLPGCGVSRAVRRRCAAAQDCG